MSPWLVCSTARRAGEVDSVTPPLCHRSAGHDRPGQGRRSHAVRVGRRDGGVGRGGLWSFEGEWWGDGGAEGRGVGEAGKVGGGRGVGGGGAGPGAWGGAWVGRCVALARGVAGVGWRGGGGGAGEGRSRGGGGWGWWGSAVCVWWGWRGGARLRSPRRRRPRSKGPVARLDREWPRWWPARSPLRRPWGRDGTGGGAAVRGQGRGPASGGPTHDPRRLGCGRRSRPCRRFRDDH